MKKDTSLIPPSHISPVKKTSAKQVISTHCDELRRSSVYGQRWHEVTPRRWVLVIKAAGPDL